MDPILVGGRTVEVISGSITSLARRFDALVSADDNYLSHGGGVSRALWAAAGPELERHVEGEAGTRLSLGDVHVTPAFALDAELLLHAITLDFDAHRRLGPLEAAALYGAAIDEVAARGKGSVAFPLLGGGLGGLGAVPSAVAFAEAIDSRAASPSTFETAALVVLDADYDAVVATLRERIKQRPPMDRLVGAVLGLGAPGERLGQAWEAVRRQPGEPFAVVQLLESTLRLVLHASLDRVRARERPLDGEGARWLGQQDGRIELKEEPEGLSRLVATSTALRKLSNDPFDAATLDLARRAIQARNQLAHGATSDPAAARVILRGCEALLLAVVPSRPPVGRVDRPSAGALSKSAPPPAAPTGGALRPLKEVEAGSGTAHVRNLWSFLQRALDARELGRLQQELDRNGYRGTEEMRLLEHCVSVEDPVEFLTERFTRSQLQDHLAEQIGADAPDADHRRCAEMLLATFGFPAASALRGPRQILQTLRAARAEVASSDLVRLRGSVTGASSHIEYLVIVLLRFLCQAAFHEAPESHFRAQKKLDKSHTIDRCALGKLLELLESLGRELQTNTSPSVAAFQHDFATGRLAPEGAMRVTQLRNGFAHYGRSEEDHDIQVTRRSATEFFDEAIAFVEHLQAEPRIFPRIVRVERIVQDRWGRRTIEAVTDEGIPERIFSDTPLQPGRVYYMHPLTNPLRVDPILVDAGDDQGPAKKS